jgi:Uma2 family endonuclease
MKVYRRNGVQEYVVWQILEGRIDWFRLVEGVYQPIAPNQDGIVQSVVFPGLRLNVAAMLSGDLQAVMAALAQPSV